MAQKIKIAVIGAGNMGSAVVRAAIGGGFAEAGDMAISNPSVQKLNLLKKEFEEIGITCSNVEAAAGARIIILAVKPYKIGEVLKELAPGIDGRRQIIVSLAAGIGTESICAYLQKESGNLPPVYCAIPNTAIAVREGMTFISAANPDEETDSLVLGLFKSGGEAMMVPENLLNAGMALASCGIAYVLRYIRAATESGVELGFRPAEAQYIIGQTMKGAVALLRESGSNPEVEIDKVTTAGGLTIRGLNTMEENGFSASVIKGIKACHATVKEDSRKNRK